ncbi:MAG: hypothetical protein M3Z27_04595 [Actinomycetota bacterium]|nr:hypothetical protein [Actinomycetota bacterium]
MGLPRAVTVVVLAGLLGGCGTASPQDQVRAKVDQFAHAAARRDYTEICAQVLSVALLERVAATGISCQETMRLALGGVSNPVLSIGRIKVSGATAAVITLSIAKGQRASLAEIDLSRESGGWRISALGSGSKTSLFGR